MSHPESTLPGNGSEPAYPPGQYEPVSLNELLRGSLSKWSDLYEPAQVILRCERLPLAAGARADLARLIDGLLYLILATPSMGSRRFLHIDCEQPAVVAMKKPDTLHLIRFHTNIVTGENWREQNAALLAECREIALRCDGDLTVHAVQNTGSLFSLLLPGKLR